MGNSTFPKWLEKKGTYRKNPTDPYNMPETL